MSAHFTEIGVCTVYRSSLCINNALGFAVQRFLESGWFRTKLLKIGYPILLFLLIWISGLYMCGVDAYALKSKVITWTYLYIYIRVHLKASLFGNYHSNFLENEINFAVKKLLKGDNASEATILKRAWVIVSLVDKRLLRARSL